MKVSLNWANSCSNVDLKSAGIDEIINRIGSQLGAIEDVQDIGKKYDGVIVAKVVNCIKHPNADKLSLCKIDDAGFIKNVERDENGFVQVVCGAPNVRRGLLVAWIPPGSTVPSTYLDSEPFILSKRELRGFMSNGMLASASELGIGDDHDGILELNSDSKPIKPGLAFKELFNLDDIVIDLENKMFTHRPDCFGILGVARELAGIQNMVFKSPNWYIETPKFEKVKDLDLTIDVKTKNVSRFMAVAMSNIKVAPSSINIQSDLSRVGIRPINNVVDITNWLMQLTGQPIHAYDYDKVSKLSKTKPIIVARDSAKGELLKLLNGKNVTFTNDQSTVIATDLHAIGVGGVMGGADTEVDENTKNIIIEIATFDMYNIRKTSMQYGLFTDAVTRFNKGQSPLQNDRILAEAMQMVKDNCSGTQASNVLDFKNDTVKKADTIIVNTDFINVRLGSSLTAKQIQSILNNVEINCDYNKDDLIINPPFWRRDLLIAEDIVEEIGRLYGFSKLPVKLPTRNSEATPKDSLLILKSKIREIMQSNGANEILTYNFIHGDLINTAKQDAKQAYQLSNALSPSLQYFRLSITPNLLEKIHPNIKAGFDEFCIYEIGKAHNKKQLDNNNLPIELERLAMVFSANQKSAKNYSGAPYYQARVYLESLFKKLNINLNIVSLDNFKEKYDIQMVAPFIANRCAIICDSKKNFIGVIGEYKYEVLNDLKLPDYTSGFELDLLLLNKLYKNTIKYIKISKYPKIEQDITLKVSADIDYYVAEQNINSTLSRVLNSDFGYSLTIIDIYSENNFKNYTFRLAITNFNTTLTTQEVNTVLDDIALSAGDALSAIRL